MSFIASDCAAASPDVPLASESVVNRGCQAVSNEGEDVENNFNKVQQQEKTTNKSFNAEKQRTMKSTGDAMKAPK
uniref:Uncharacterized protein n=1 Tax=Caenorhabditis tropicalis TaxID=1561998 RepID=A0A1I7UZG1_9PELO